MHRRIFLRNAAVLTGTSMLLQQQLMAQIFGTAEGNIKMLRKNVGMFTERGGTIGFALTNEGIVVIDSQYPDTATHFMEEVKKLHAQPFSYLLNTHHHGDHTGGNIVFKDVVKQVVAHKNSLVNQQRVAEKANNLDKQLLPNVTFEKETKLKAGNEKIKGHYFGAAHTNGDAIFHMQEANVVHMGDLMANKRHPYVDRTAGANMNNWINVLNKSLKEFNKDTIYIFGHARIPGEESGKAADVQKFRDYLSRVLDFARAEIKKGTTKEQFIKNTSIPGVTEWTTDGIERPLTAAFEELSMGV